MVQLLLAEYYSLHQELGRVQGWPFSLWIIGCGKKRYLRLNTGEKMVFSKLIISENVHNLEQLTVGKSQEISSVVKSLGIFLFCFVCFSSFEVHGCPKNNQDKIRRIGLAEA